MKNKVFVALSSFAEFSDAPLRLLRESGVAFSTEPLSRRLNRDEIVQFAKECEGIIAGVEPYDEYVLEHLPRLRCISRCGTGVDNIAMVKAKQLGISVLNTPDAPVISVAEMTVALILNLIRNVSHHDSLMKTRVWEKKVGVLLSGKKVGIIGLGRIGRRVAQLLIPFGVSVMATDLYPDHSWARKYGVEIVPVDRLLEEADVITIHISILNDFKIGSEEFAKMKNEAYLINMSRGQVIDENALYYAIKSKHLSGAALDVFEKEPYDGPLCDLDNVVLSPHAATYTKECRVQMEVEAVRNLLNFFSQESDHRSPTGIRSGQ